MPTLTARDGTQLAYREVGEGEPLLCLPGGPMLDARYLGDLGGLAARRRLILLDLRGTGDSATPDDITSYRCDRQVDDVDMLREHLGLERIDLLGHSAGANLAVMYAAALPDRIARLVLVTPSTRAVGIEIDGATRVAAAQLRPDEPWLAGPMAALERITTGAGGDDDWDAIAPLSYGRWDAAAAAHHAAELEQGHPEAAAVFGEDGVFTADATRAALAAMGAPVLVLAGEFDISAPPIAMESFAAMFPAVTFVVQASAGHFPWLDDAERFVVAVDGFLT